MLTALSKRYDVVNMPSVGVTGLGVQPVTQLVYLTCLFDYLSD